jgi:hypothetical protein
MSEWISLHIYYASNCDPVIRQCVQPLVADLRERGLLQRWFFIRYWLEGPHLRLRLLPHADAGPAVAETAEAAIATFLARRPALYDASAAPSDVYRQMFVAEYGEQRWAEEYGDTDQMPFRANNSVHRQPYVPEHDRYGGAAGIALAERHFETSSELFAGLLATTNTHVRSVLLGTSAQLAAALCYAFLGDDDRVAQFFATYRAFWERSYQQPSDDQHARFDAGFDAVATELRGHLARLRDGVAQPASARLTAVERGWISHAVALRDEVVQLADAGQLTFHRRGEPGAEVVTDHDAAFAILLSSYVHMTNNRLGVSILDEVYLSYLICRALTAPVAVAA